MVERGNWNRTQTLMVVIIVIMISFALNFAFRYPANPLQMPPARKLRTKAIHNTPTVPNEASLRETITAISAPIYSCPSAPILKSPALKAKAKDKSP